MIHRAEHLATVRPELAAVVRRAAELLPDGMGILVVEGRRSIERQRQLVASGASRTLNSKHLPGPDGLARAVDLGALVNGRLRWDWPLYPKVNAAMQRAAEDLEVQLVWGGHWRRFRDGPHWELA